MTTVNADDALPSFSEPSRRSGERGAFNAAAAVMAQTPDMAEAAPEILRLVRESLGMRRASLALLDQETGEVVIDAASGLTGDQVSLGRYRLGEGVTGRVAATGGPAVVTHIANCREYLNRTGGFLGEDGSFVCVPVTLGDEILGTISADCAPREEARLWEDARFLAVIATLMAQGIKTRLQERERRLRLADENKRLRDELLDRQTPGGIIGNSREMRIVYDQIAQVAGSNATVLIHGETGTGKELVARALHVGGSRRDGPFVRVNCAALPETLIESELFGHEKGAFTGASAARAGRFEQADGGSIFLDEIGDISPLMQVKLLRVLQEREFERVGGNRTIKIDVRVIAATNRDLGRMAREGAFRGDLYYRVNVFPIFLLPLRKRLADLPLLAEHFLRKYAAAAGKEIVAISPDAIDMMTGHSWPGNVRELENCIEHAVILAGGPVIRASHLPASLRQPAENERPAAADLKTMVDDFERGLLEEALRETGGNITRAAERLGTTPRIVSYRARQLGINAGSR
ncbi:MAG: sigma 54-interacting transcriptional regulator [Planctomycetota bacterium]|jgi:Nif-specific regulatory protein|nr:sigma 54-interacting transcriptional regulator [Planctomycetota bacterium]